MNVLAYWVDKIKTVPVDDQGFWIQCEITDECGKSCKQVIDDLAQLISHIDPASFEKGQFESLLSVVHHSIDIFIYG